MKEDYYIGKVVWFNKEKDFGFILVDKDYKVYGGKEIFFHRSAVLSPPNKLLDKGDIVTFKISPSAIKITKVTSCEEDD